MSDQNSPEVSFSTKHKFLISRSLTLFYHLKKGKLTTMDKGKNIKIEQTEGYL